MRLVDTPEGGEAVAASANVQGSLIASEAVREGLNEKGPSRIRTGDGGFAIRRQEDTTINQDSQLGQLDIAEVPTVVPCSSEPPLFNNLPPELAKIASVWNDLPQVAKAGILAMIEASTGSLKDDAAGEQARKEGN